MKLLVIMFLGFNVLGQENVIIPKKITETVKSSIGHWNKTDKILGKKYLRRNYLCIEEIIGRESTVFFENCYLEKLENNYENLNSAQLIQCDGENRYLGGNLELIQECNEATSEMGLPKSNEAFIVQPPTVIEKVREIPKDSIVYDFPDAEPMFPGGQEELQRYISNSINYPEEALKEGLEDRIYLSFIVEKNGSISNIKVERGIQNSLIEEAIRVTKLMPLWHPGKVKGESVRTRHSLPIFFKL